ncbi:hypothetical protein [Streptomyces indicus]|uniref:Lipoprotein n=1 Tax=Streptomyces indicus TaxID=417292 RepID=A0A1G9HDS4_9ACTN|nr:hypothetical protein [Streptomyces indicus]SDL10854.1 hypothetical protein SAMN05421806_118131 [Streptomyces indicus]
MVVQQLEGRRSGRSRRLLAAPVGAGLAALVLATTGCSPGGAAADDAGGDPREVLRRAADELVEARTARARTSMEMASGGTRVTIRGAGTYDFVRRVGELEVQLPQDPSGAEPQAPITEMLAPGALYMKNRGAGVPADKWVRIDTASLSDGNLVTGGATDPLTAAELLRGAHSVEYVGPAEVNGTAVRHYRGVTDLARAAELAPKENRAVLRAAAKGFSTDTVPFDAYLDDQGRLRKIRQEFSFANGQTDGGSQGAKPAGGTEAGSGAETGSGSGSGAGSGSGSGAASGAEGVAVVSTTWLDAFGTKASARLPEAEDIYAGKIATG